MPVDWVNGALRRACVAGAPIEIVSKVGDTQTTTDLTVQYALDWLQNRFGGEALVEQVPGRGVRPPSDAPRMRDYGQLLARYWVVIVLATALSAAAGWLVWHHERSYVASVKFLVVTPGGAQPFDAFYGNLTAMSRTTTYEDPGPQPAGAVAQPRNELGVDRGDATLVKGIIVVPSASAVFDVLVSASRSRVARKTANALARNMVARVERSAEDRCRGRRVWCWSIPPAMPPTPAARRRR